MNLAQMGLLKLNDLNARQLCELQVLSAALNPKNKIEPRVDED